MKKPFNFYVQICLLVGVFTFNYQNAEAQKKRKIPLEKVSDYKVEEMYSVKLKDQSNFYGKLIEDNGDVLVFESTLGMRYEVNKSNINTIMKVDPINFVNGKYWFPNPHGTRYLFGPSAFNLKTGEGYYQNIYGTVNSVNFGISDHFTLGAGTELISLFSGFPVLAVTPKFGGYRINDSWYAGGGGFLLIAEGGAGGIGYGIVTYGNQNNNITFGLGWAFVNFDGVGSLPIATISGMRRFAKNFAFISENWLLPADPYVPIFSYGIRFFGEQMSVDVAFVNNYSIATEILPIGFPFVDFVYKF